MPKQTTIRENITLPPVIFGTSGLGNLYNAVPYETKLEIVRECVIHSPGIPVFDTAGKYGAGLSLESLGKCLNDIGVAPDKVIISNKLGWFRVPLTTTEPTFEQGVWFGLEYDAVQKISYEGILECYEQGNQLLNGYLPQMVSVHDPDEYLATAKNDDEEAVLYQNILGAYKALAELRISGKVKAVGVGAKSWKTIQRIAKDVELDWVMFANSLTLHSHPKELIDYIAELHQKNITIINSAVFNGGFLIGSDYYNYKQVEKDTPEGAELLAWRDNFFKLCNKHGVLPAEACFNFGFHIPGIKSVALNTTKPEKVKNNILLATKEVPQAFWDELGVGI